MSNKQDQRGRLALQRQLEDYNKLAENEFWHKFLRYIKEEAYVTLKSLAKEEYTEQKLRYWQGAYKALTRVCEEYPDRILKEIRREIDK